MSDPVWTRVFLHKLQVLANMVTIMGNRKKNRNQLLLEHVFAVLAGDFF
jgi:hypothetical protein